MSETANPKDLWPQEYAADWCTRLNPRAGAAFHPESILYINIDNLVVRGPNYFLCPHCGFSFSSPFDEAMRNIVGYEPDALMT